MPHPPQPFRVAAVEFNPELFEFDRNVERACAVVAEAASNGARLIVLPEAALSGYIYRDREQFLPYLDTVPGRGTEALAAITAGHGCYVAIGIAEIDRATGLTYNTGALIGPDGYVGKYRKNGLNPSDIAWFVPGNTGHPVFDTELGRITMIICYDDTYFEPARLPAVKGADLIAYICSSDRVIATGSQPAGNHSTIAAVQQLSAWNGLAMVAADRNNAETNPTTGVSVYYGGCASIWQADGRRTAHAPATSANTTATNPGTIQYGDIDPALFDNDQKRTLGRRRPELYAPLAFFRAPTDPLANSTPHQVELAALQYEVAPGDVAANVAHAGALVDDRIQGESLRPGLWVLPAFSFTGAPGDRDQAVQFAETAVGRSTQIAGDWATRSGRHVVVSFVEHDGDDLFCAASLLAPDGTVAGHYRQTHLDPAFDWATPGVDLPVIDTAIGRIGMLLNQDVRFPEASGVLAVHRADLIAIPTHWRGDYGGPLHDAAGLFAHQYPPNTMAHWYAVAKTSQAYTVVANGIGAGCQGSSGVFSINPVDSDEPPVVGPADAASLVTTEVTTLGNPDWWLNQSRLVGGRRADLAVPLMLPPDSAPFQRWQSSPGWDYTGWTGYRQH